MKYKVAELREMDSDELLDLFEELCFELGQKNVTEFGLDKTVYYNVKKVKEEILRNRMKM